MQNWAAYQATKANPPAKWATAGKLKGYIHVHGRSAIFVFHRPSFPIYSSKTEIFINVHILILHPVTPKTFSWKNAPFFLFFPHRRDFKLGLFPSTFPVSWMKEVNLFTFCLMPKVVRYKEGGHYHCHHDSEEVAHDKPCCLYGSKDCRLCR